MLNMWAVVGQFEYNIISTEREREGIARDKIPLCKSLCTLLEYTEYIVHGANKPHSTTKACHEHTIYNSMQCR